MGPAIASRPEGNSVMADRKFLDFLDMIDGGGAGQMGDKFQGGGLYSVLGNLMASPYGSQDEERRKARMAFYGSDNIGGAPMAAPAPVQTAGSMAPTPVAPPTAQERYGMNPPAAYTPPAQSPLEMFGGMAPAPYSPEPQYGGRGSVGMPYPEWAQDDLTRQTIDYLRQMGVPGY
jgi:hypothetical protein